MSKVDEALKNQIREYYRLKKEEEQAAKDAKILGAGIHELFRRSGKKNIEVDNIIIEFVEETDGSSVKYKEAFYQALSKVNTVTAKVLQDILLENTKVTKVSAQLKKAKGSTLTEGIFDNIKGKALEWYHRIISKYKSLFSEKEKAQDTFILYYSNLSKHHTTEPKTLKEKILEAVNN